MSQEGENSKKISKKRKRDRLAILAALTKNRNAGVIISGKQSSKRHFSCEEVSGDGIVRSSQSQRSRYIGKNGTKSKKGKETIEDMKKKKNIKRRKNSLPSEDSCDELYGVGEFDDEELSDRDFSNDDDNDQYSTENSSDDDDYDGSSSETESSEGEESIPNSPTNNKKGSKKRYKQARIRELYNQSESEDEQGNGDPESPNGSSDDNPSTKESHQSKKPRGCTYPPAVLDSSLKKKVMFNEKKQPIGENSVAFSSELGSLARDLVPLTCDDWRSVDQSLKDVLWDTVLAKFIVDEALGKSYTLQSIGKLWRAHKSRLRRNIRAYRRKNDDISTLKPNAATDTEWAYFVKKLSRKAFKKKSKKFRDMRKKQDLPHTCGRRGYARLEEKMKKESPNPSSITRTDIWMEGHTKKNGEASNEIVAEKMKLMRDIRKSAAIDPSQETIRNDPVSQVLGADRNGHVRGGGSGVTPSKLDVISQNSAIITQLQAQVTSLTENQVELTALVRSQEALIRTLLTNNQGHSSTPLATNEVDSPASPSNTPVVTRPDVSAVHVSVPNDFIVAGDQHVSKCKLMNWAMPNELVAIARWDTSDPGTLVHGKPLGQNASRVWVEEIMKPLTPLWRKTSDDEMQTLAHVKKTPIAWPTDRIEFIER